MRRKSIFPRNDNLLLIRGLVDEVDPVWLAGAGLPTYQDGSPKWIDAATGTWQIRTLEYPNGVVTASGVVIPQGSGGNYRIELSDAISILAETGYWVHIELNSPAGYHVELDDSFEAISRTGRSPTT